MCYIQFQNGYPTVKGYKLEAGDKITDGNNTEEGCRNISDELSQHEIKNRIGFKPESGIWSVAILEILHEN